MHDELNQSTLTLDPTYCGRFTRLSPYSISGGRPQSTHNTRLHYEELQGRR